MWLEPSDFRPGPDEPVSVRLFVGHGESAEPVRRDPRRILRLEAMPPPPDDSRSPLVGAVGQDPVGYVRPGHPGTWILAYESSPARSELPADRFEAYLAEEGLERVRRLRKERGTEGEPGRELYSRSLKSLVAVGGRPLEDREIGLPLELVLESVGTSVVARVRFRGRPLPGALVELSELGSDRDIAQRADAEGRVRWPARPARWRLAVVHSEPVSTTSTAEADWRSWFSTLTFEITS